MHQVPVTTKVESSNPVHGEVYSIQQYVIKFASDLQQVGGFLWFLPPINLPRCYLNIVKSGINHHNPNKYTILCSDHLYGLHYTFASFRRICLIFYRKIWGIKLDKIFVFKGVWKYLFIKIIFLCTIVFGCMRIKIYIYI